MKRIFTLFAFVFLCTAFNCFAQNPPTAFVAGTATGTTLPFSWTAGSGGSDYYIVRSTTSTVSDLSNGPAPAYAVNDVLANGTVVGITGTTGFTDNTLTPGTQYWYKIFNHKTTGPNDNFSTGLTGTMTTLALPVISGVAIPAGNYKINDVITLTIGSNGTGYTLGTSTVNAVTPTNLRTAGGNNYLLDYTVGSGNTDMASVGAIPISIILVNGVGNSVAYTSAPTSGGTVAIDANVPAAPSTPDLAAADDSGSSNS